MNRHAWPVLLLALLTSPVNAQTINNLGSAGALGGTESVPVFQGSNPAVKTTTQAIANLAVTSIATGCQATGGTITTTGTISTAEVPRTAAAANAPILGTDCGQLVNFTQATNDAPTIAVAGSTGFPNGWFTELCNISANTKTITPASGTIGGAANKVLNAASASSPQCMRIVSDGAGNYLINAGIVPASSTIAGGSTPTSGITSGNVVGSSSNLIVDTGVAYANLPLLNGANAMSGANTFSSTNTFSGAGAASTSSVIFSGVPFTGGTGTTTFPGVLIQPSTATASTTWSTTGTGFGINVHTGTAQIFDFQLDGVSRMSLSASTGSITMVGNITDTGASSIWTNGATGQFTFNGRGILTSPGAGAWQLGAAAAAVPVAQTLQSQGSRPASDSNVGGGNLTIASGNGTGTGAISALVLQAPVAVASGTGAQTMTTGLTIKGGQAVMTAYTVSTLPTGITGGRAYVSDATACTYLGALTGGAATFCPAVYNGSAWVGG